MADRVSARLTKAEGRGFGLKVGLAFVVLGGVAWWRGRVHVVAPFETAGVVLIAAGLLVPTRLGPVFRAWMGLGQLLSKVTTPVFLGVVFFIVLAPVGLVMRLTGRSPLPRGKGWVPRAPDARARTDMLRQF